jgi:pimeloyl-ACP methyl ester carboxylesterase
MTATTCLALAATVAAAASCSRAHSAIDKTPKLETGYAPIGNLRIYYEIRGTGEPLILLHGALGATEMFAPILPALAEHHRVISVDLQGHGRTADVDRPLRYETMADDVAALVAYLRLGKVDIAGYSLGGGVALEAAIRHPEIVNKLVLISTACKRDGWYPEILAGMAQMSAAAAEPMKRMPMYPIYQKLAPRPADWPVLLDKLGELLRTDYDWSKAVAAVTAPTLIVAGDADAVRTAHVVELFGLLGGGQHDGGWDGSHMPRARLAILPGTTHYTIFASPALAAVMLPFLDAK